MTNKLILGYDLDFWNNMEIKIPITTDISPATNSHILVSGMSGGGKSYYANWIFKNLILATGENQGEYYFNDYKGDDSFSYLRNCLNYKSYRNTLKNIDIVYSILNERLAGNPDRTPVCLLWDEYIANILALIGEDKNKKLNLAIETMNRVSEILLMGRSMAVKIVNICQRPDALAFPVGSRLNYGIVVIIGAAVRSIYEMLIPDFMEQVKGRQFGRGEGVILLQGSQLKFFKCPIVRDIESMRELCVNALS